MLKIRLFRMGKRNQPLFRIVVTEKKSPPKGGRPLEILGFYNPLTKEKKFKKERIEYWLSVGAQLSETVHNLLVSEGIVKDKKKSVHKKAKKKKIEKPVSEERDKKEEPEKEAKEKIEEKAESVSDQAASEKKEKPEKKKETEKKD